MIDSFAKKIQYESDCNAQSANIPAFPCGVQMFPGGQESELVELVEVVEVFEVDTQS